LLEGSFLQEMEEVRRGRKVRKLKAEVLDKNDAQIVKYWLGKGEPNFLPRVWKKAWREKQKKARVGPDAKGCRTE